MPPHHQKRKPLLSSTRSHRLSHPSHLSTTSISTSSSSSSTKLLPSTQARTLIRQHHILQKRLAAARATRDSSLITALEARIATSGGLARYQRASLAGQAKTRGGDSSHVLVRWIWEMMDERRGRGGRVIEREGEGEGGGKNGRRGRRHNCSSESENERGWRMLEVGALRVDNAAARSGLFASVERIDLHAQEKGIITQDFMQRPFPRRQQEEGFDVVSLSLVVNYVGDPAARGEMLRRVEGFLRKRKRRKMKGGEGDEEEKDINDDDGDDDHERSIDAPSMFPGLFLVLPAPCVTNSRYLDEERLEAMMRGLGYVRAKRKLSLKLVYYFWRWEGRERGREPGAMEGGQWRGRFGEEGRQERGAHGEEEEEGEQEYEGEGEKGEFKSEPQTPTQWPKTELPNKKGAKRNNFAVVFK